MQEKTHILDRVSSFSLLLTMVILMIIGAALIPLVDVGSSPKPRQGKTLTISYGWRNASPKVVEQEVTSKIEGLVSAVKGVAEATGLAAFSEAETRLVTAFNTDKTLGTVEGPSVSAAPSTAKPITPIFLTPNFFSYRYPFFLELCFLERKVHFLSLFSKHTEEKNAVSPTK